MMKTKGIYIHIPFCLKRCSYCDFLTFEGLKAEEIQAYFDGLEKHITDYKADDSSKKKPVNTIYIGGGSPSFVDGRYIVRLMEVIKKKFQILEDAEITIEANPETMEKTKLESYKAAGINRLSIGVQSFDDKLLKMLNRAHDRDEFLKKYKLARDVGFNNISLDLIFALPGQSLDIWKETLKEAIGLKPEHISFYGLQIEEGTLLKKLIDSGKLEAVDEEIDREMYHYGIDFLGEHGYIHYEISNAAKAGYSSRHNLKYWSMEDYLSFGLGAHSYISGTRVVNSEDMKAYLQGEYIKESHKNTREDEMVEYLFTGLRKTEGISLKGFEESFNIPLEEAFKKPLEKHLKVKLLEFKIKDKEKYLKLTRKGLDLFNRVLVDFV